MLYTRLPIRSVRSIARTHLERARRREQICALVGAHPCVLDLERMQPGEAALEAQRAVGAIHAWHEICARRTIEAQLRRSQRKLRALQWWAWRARLQSRATSLLRLAQEIWAVATLRACARRWRSFA